VVALLPKFVTPKFTRGVVLPTATEPVFLIAKTASVRAGLEAHVADARAAVMSSMLTRAAHESSGQ
jgi:hypothetical protein